MVVVLIIGMEEGMDSKMGHRTSWNEVPRM